VARLSREIGLKHGSYHVVLHQRKVTKAYVNHCCVTDSSDPHGLPEAAAAGEVETVGRSDKGPRARSIEETVTHRFAGVLDGCSVEFGSVDFSIRHGEVVAVAPCKRHRNSAAELPNLGTDLYGQVDKTRKEG